ncbi:glycosyltransferase [Carboxylicivirga mesophila]|uniref:Glycosyltransferase n=1 Tax=Carboxylicivirga mesophila TaxID=1166478 RepID=A0ABS5K917_9BACT|nr:glycosyltransferase [Carboxylicivirga mesophila]MBS2211494.1 glycosyltransferase [Carboxylicivirga mesophila]
MKVLCLTAHGPYRAGKVAYDLHSAFKSNGYESRLLTIYDDSDHKDVISIYNAKEWNRLRLKKKIFRKFNKWFGGKKQSPAQKIDRKYQFFELDNTIEYFATDLILQCLGDYQPDVIIVFFTTQFITAKNIKQLAQKTNATVLWQFLDMAPLTGGCHYAWECDGYKNNCGKCPALYSSDSNDQSAINLRFKQQNVEGYDLRLMIGSRWDELNTKASSLFKNKRLYRTFMSVEPDIFTPASRQGARRELTIADDEFVVFFGSVHFGEERKGMDHLLKALHKVEKHFKEQAAGKNISLLIAGSTNNFPVHELPFRYRMLGYLKEVDQLAHAYAAADIFICPSIYDSGPVMINQALMTGTPVVSFEMGVALDLVEHYQTGYLAKWADADDLSEGIKYLVNLSEEARAEMRQRCREKAIELYAPAAVVANYTAVFEEIKMEKTLS